MVHGCMVYTERAETAAVSRGTSHVSAVRKRKKRKEKKVVTHAESQASAGSLLESGEEAQYKSYQQQLQCFTLFLIQSVENVRLKAGAETRP